MTSTQGNKMQPDVRVPGPLVSITDERWISFIKENPGATIFHQPAWSLLMEECYGYKPFVIAVPGMSDALAAGVPMMEVNSPLTGKRWVSLPFSDSCSPFYHDDVAFHKLTEQIVVYARSHGITTLELRDSYPSAVGLSPYSNFVLHKIDMRGGEQEIWDHIDRKQRHNVKLARDNGLRVITAETQEHLKEFYRLHLQTRHRLGVPVQPWKYFMILKRSLFDRNLGFLLLAYKDEQCIAGSVFLHSGNTLTYKYGASMSEASKYHPNNLILWSAIQWGCSHGYTCLDMGRTDLENSGLRNFKSRWGAVEQPLYYSRLSPKSVRSTASKLDRLLHFVIKNSPVWVCRYMGELLYKHVG